MKLPSLQTGKKISVLLFGITGCILWLLPHAYLKFYLRSTLPAIQNSSDLPGQITFHKTSLCEHQLLWQINEHALDINIKPSWHWTGGLPAIQVSINVFESGQLLATMTQHTKQWLPKISLDTDWLVELKAAKPLINLVHSAPQTSKASVEWDTFSCGWNGQAQTLQCDSDHLNYDDSAKGIQAHISQLSFSTSLAPLNVESPTMTDATVMLGPLSVVVANPVMDDQNENLFPTTQWDIESVNLSWPSEGPKRLLLKTIELDSSSFFDALQLEQSPHPTHHTAFNFAGVHSKGYVEGAGACVFTDATSIDSKWSLELDGTVDWQLLSAWAQLPLSIELAGATPFTLTLSSDGQLSGQLQSDGSLSTQ